MGEKMKKSKEELLKEILNYDKTIELNPTDAIAYNSRGNSKSDLERHEEAYLRL